MYIYDYKVNTTTINLCTPLTLPRKHIGQCSEEQTLKKAVFVMVLYCRTSGPACYLGSPSQSISDMRLRREEMVYGPLLRTVATMRLSKIQKEECDKFKEQMIDVIKILGIGIPYMLIPGSSLLLALVVSIAKKYKINILPSSFKDIMDK
jgi:hypothetical protein